MFFFLLFVCACVCGLGLIIVFAGERFGVGVGSNFTPHIITVNAGEVWI